ncbi:hypothetical protein HMPREF0731_4616, partial [Pseudoroseomonas cervicalis ATCC 49957]
LHRGAGGGAGQRVGQAARRQRQAGQQQQQGGDGQQAKGGVHAGQSASRVPGRFSTQGCMRMIHTPATLPP